MENKVYIANLGKYNEGYLVGAWFDLPVDFEEVSKKIGLNRKYEEYAIHDYDLTYPLRIEEYTSIETLNKMFEEVESIEGLKELCVEINGENKNNEEKWAMLAASVFSELDIDYDILSDEDVEKMMKEKIQQGSGWVSIRNFLHHAQASDSYHTLDGYGLLKPIHHEDVKIELRDALRWKLENL